MIEEIKIAGCATYSPEGAKLSDLKEINFIYGENGSGKTTISRIIEDFSSSTKSEKFPSCEISWTNGEPLECLVYNTDFVEKNFQSELPGIFTLGENDINLHNMINELNNKIRDKATFINNLKENLDGKNKSLEIIKKHFDDSCWKLKLRYSNDFKEALTGTRGAKKDFSHKLITEYSSNQATLQSFEYLQERVATIFSDDRSEVAYISQPNASDILQLEKDPIFDKKIVGKNDIDIGELIHSLGNSDWVKQGLNYFRDSAPQCPFCQQDINNDLAKQISNYFDDTYNRDIEEIHLLLNKYNEEGDRYYNEISSVKNSNSPYVNIDNINDLSTRIRTHIDRNIKSIEQKLNEPSKSIKLEDITILHQEVFERFKEANNKIKLHNEDVNDRSNRKNKLIKEIWKFLINEIKSDISDFINKKKPYEKAIKSLTEKIELSKKQNNELKNKLQVYVSKTTNVQSSVEEMNSYLASFGFEGFKLSTTGTQKEKYKIIRPNGSDVERSLSEGERNFVSFLYFYCLIKGSFTESGISNDRVIVFDDPISSLDTNILFIVSSLIKGIFDKSRKKDSNIKQIFILTHNIYFHKEVSFEHKINRTDKTKEHFRPMRRTFWIVRKSGDCSTLDGYKQNNPIKTSYELLWSDVSKALSDTEHGTNHTLQNTLRRILETYFEIFGCMDRDKIISRFDGNEQAACRALFYWANAGSHDMGDDLYASLNALDTINYLNIFKEIFYRTGHEQHYKMMLHLNEDEE